MNIRQTMIQQIDKAVLYSLNRSVPDSLESSVAQAPTLEEVLAETQVDKRQTAVYQLTAPGEHSIVLQTGIGEIKCRVYVRPAVNPQAPLLLFHHGINEYPYTNAWLRLFPKSAPLPFHTVCIQAPFHDNWLDPIKKGFASVRNLYQIFAGSLRMMAMVQRQFEAEGAAYTTAAGVSWGGITNVLYESMFQQTRAVIPMLASPNLAQVISDVSNMFNRPMQLTQAELRRYLDFTDYYQQCAPNRVFPLLGENDMFFRMEKHADLFAERPLVTTPGGHISNMWQIAPLRAHVLSVLRGIDAT